MPKQRLEAQFFDDTEGKGSEPLSAENPALIRGNRTWLLVIMGGLLGGIILTLLLLLLPGESPAVAEPAVTVLIPLEDAGTDPVDAPAAPVEQEQAVVAPDLVDAGVPEDVETGDAGAMAVLLGGESQGPKDGVDPEVARDAGPPSEATDELAKLIRDAKAAQVAQQFRKAAQLYRSALKLRPDDPSLRAGLGIALVMSDMAYADAIPHLKEAVKVDPGNSEAWLALGIAFQNVGRAKEAKAPYQEFLKLRPKGKEAEEVRAALQLIP